VLQMTGYGHDAGNMLRNGLTGIISLIRWRKHTGH